MTATPAPASRRRSLAPGILLGVLAVLLLLIAAVVFGVSQISARLSSSPTVEIPQPLELDLAAGSYDIYLSDDSIRDMDDPVSAIVCDVTNGAPERVRGADQTLVGSDDNGEELIGGFTASGGPMTVTCDFADGHASSDYFYRVQPSSPPALVAAVVLLVAGLVAGGVSALIIVVTVRARRRG